MTEEKLLPDMRTLDSKLKEPLGDRIGNHYKSILTDSWVFSTYLEKTIIIAMFGWCLYSVFKLAKFLIWGL